MTDFLTKALELNNAKSTQTIYLESEVYNLFNEKQKTIRGFTFDLKEKKSVITEFLKLPRYINVDGIQFEPKICLEGSSLTLVYSVYDIGDDSKHKEMWDNHGCWVNPFLTEDKYYTCGFLWLQQYIDTDEFLISSIEECYQFLKENNLLPNEQNQPPQA